jgi:hypothetical protein
MKLSEYISEDKHGTPKWSDKGCLGLVIGALTCINRDDLIDDVLRMVIDIQKSNTVNTYEDIAERYARGMWFVDQNREEKNL